MDLDTASVFLTGSIIYGLGLIALTIAVVVINNILFKFWKKFEMFTLPKSSDEQLRFVTEQEMAMIEKQRANNETKVS